jgi:hypothetical protein
LDHLNWSVREQAERLNNYRQKNIPVVPFELGKKIDWDSAPQRLQTGDLSELDETTARAIQQTAIRPDMTSCAARFGLEPIILVVGILARVESSNNRSAARIAKAIFGSQDLEIQRVLSDLF